MSAPSPTTSSTTNRDQQFCLRWNNYQSNLTQVFNQLFQSESFVDVTLACEGHSVKAHRMVLSACSPYFQNVLNQTPCTHPVIILQGVKWSQLKAVVEFMYKGEINVCQEQLGPLLRVAESLKIRGLTDVGGEEAEAVITSPTGSPRSASQFWSEEAPRKRRRISSDEPRSRSRTPSPGSNTPVSINITSEGIDSSLNNELVGTLSRGSASSSSNPAVPSPVASLASSLSSFAHFHTPMPPPGPPLPPHLAHLPPLSPLSPLLNMHPMNKHHTAEDFEIRPGIAEMIREEERVSDAMRGNRRIDKETYAKLIESTHHWMSNPMADAETSSAARRSLLKHAKKFSSKEELKLTKDSKFNFAKIKTQENDLGLVPEKQLRVKASSKWTQEDLTLALLMVKNGTPIKPAAERYRIPVMTLWRRTRALGLVSSKVQCGFRYSPAKGTFASYQSPKSEHQYSNAQDEFIKERSPLTDANKKLSLTEEPSSTKLKLEKQVLKENSPCESSTEARDMYASTTALTSVEDQNLKVPPKEFLAWLSCLGQNSPTECEASNVNNSHTLKQ